jgi:hypothetical protein
MYLHDLPDRYLLPVVLLRLRASLKGQAGAEEAQRGRKNAFSVHIPERSI